MEIRRIEKKDLPMIAKLAKDETIETRNDICFEHSKMCLSDDGEALCFIVLCERSLLEFFNGNIPMDENVEYDEDYEEGEEWWVKEDIEYIEEHYEIIAAYLKEGITSKCYYWQNLLFAVECDLHDDHYGPQIGILWSTQDLPSYADFYHFNNVVWIDFPILD